MTEAEWHNSEQAYVSLLFVRSFSSVRKLRLVAAAFSRWLKPLPGYEDARDCSELIEEVADDAKPFSEIECRAYALPGTSWALSKGLAPDEQIGSELSRMLFNAECRFLERSENPEPVHRKMIDFLHEIYGNPLRPSAPLDPSLLTPPILALARDIYDSRAFERVPELATILEKQSCIDAELLGHLKAAGPHVKGCWGLDLVLARS